MGPTWVLSSPGGSHVDPMNLAILVYHWLMIRIMWLANPYLAPRHYRGHSLLNHKAILRGIYFTNDNVHIQQTLHHVCNSKPCYTDVYIISQSNQTALCRDSIGTCQQSPEYFNWPIRSPQRKPYDQHAIPHSILCDCKSGRHFNIQRKSASIEVPMSIPIFRINGLTIMMINTVEYIQVQYSMGFNAARRCQGLNMFHLEHYNDVTMSAMAPQITSLTIVYSTVYWRRR